MFRTAALLRMQRKVSLFDAVSDADWLGSIAMRQKSMVHVDGRRSRLPRLLCVLTATKILHLTNWPSNRRTAWLQGYHASLPHDVLSLHAFSLQALSFCYAKQSVPVASRGIFVLKMPTDGHLAFSNITISRR